MQTSKPTLVKAIAFSTRAAIALACYGFCLAHIQNMPDDRLRSACNSLGSVAGTLLGFLVAALSILATSSNRKFMGNLVKVGLYSRLTNETVATCVLLLASVVTSMVSQFLDDQNLQWWACSLAFLFALALIYVWEAGKRFVAVIRYL